MTPDAARETMAGLIGLFGMPAAEIPSCEPVEPEAIPEPRRSLLAHDRHMTVTLEDHLGGPVAVAVLGSAFADGRRYARRSLLSDPRTGRVVQYGIVAMDLGFCAPEVRDLIVAGEIPLGRVLIDHGVMRRVELESLLRIAPNSEMRAALNVPAGDPVYGRFATIHCDGEPAVKLLEVLGPAADPGGRGRAGG